MFKFGNDFMQRNISVEWSPDAEESQNPHLMIVGGSGSGKTRLLKKIIAYLQQNNKQIYIIDFHGDIKIPNETEFIFTSRNSPYGLNPFEIEKDPLNGGVNAQVEILIALFKKNIFPNMGALQKTVLKLFLTKLYEYVGIFDEDESTWNKEIPTMELMHEFYQRIKNTIKFKEGSELCELIKSIELLQIKLNILDEKEDSIEAVEKQKKAAIKKLEKNISAINELFNGKYFPHIKRRLENKDYNFDGYTIGKVDVSEFHDENIKKTFLSLYPYISELSSTSIFKENKPPKARGVVRYNISGFTNIDKPLEAMFFNDIIVQKIFRAVKMRGEYRKIANNKCDTFIVIDESKIILPTGKDKENPYNLFNRIVTEARKYGLGLIIVSQRPNHFPQEMLSNIYTKICLRLNENDIPSAMKSLGIREKEIFKHTEKIGVGLVGFTGKPFRSVSIFEKEKK